MLIEPTRTSPLFKIEGKERALRWNDGRHGKRFNASGRCGRAKPHVAPYVRKA